MLLVELDLQGLIIQADDLHTRKPFFNSSRSKATTFLAELAGVADDRRGCLSEPSVEQRQPVAVAKPWDPCMRRWFN
jgi:hypothetical protein